MGQSSYIPLFKFPYTLFLFSETVTTRKRERQRRRKYRTIVHAKNISDSVQLFGILTSAKVYCSYRAESTYTLFYRINKIVKELLIDGIRHPQEVIKRSLVEKNITVEYEIGKCSG